MKNFLINLSLSALSLGTLHAQHILGEAFFGTNSQAISSLSEQARFSVLNSYAGNGKSGTDANVSQTGNQNTANLKLSGSGNNIVTRQTGDLNVLNMDYSGNNSQYILEQEGNSNKLQMNTIKSSGINFQAIQTDNSNSLTLEGSSIGSLQSMKIEQSGGMKIIIESNPIFGKP